MTRVLLIINSLIALYYSLMMGIGYHSVTREIMEEAYNRGFAVQCVSEPGYHWECDENQ